MITSVKAGKRSDRGWTPEEDQQLLDLFDAEASWPLIAITLERGVEEVKDRAEKLNVAKFSSSGCRLNRTSVKLLGIRRQIDVPASLWRV
jgi:hypothetical protein